MGSVWVCQRNALFSILAAIVSMITTMIISTMMPTKTSAA